MKVYIAGPITNNPDYKNQFKEVENQFKRFEGVSVVINPATLPTGLSQQEYMSICIPMLYCCNTIYLLKGWENSLGANIEKQLAEQAGMTVMYQEY